MCKNCSDHDWDLVWTDDGWDYPEEEFDLGECGEEIDWDYLFQEAQEPKAPWRPLTQAELDEWYSQARSGKED